MELKDFNIFNLSLQQKKLLKKKVGQGGESADEGVATFLVGMDWDENSKRFIYFKLLSGKQKVYNSKLLAIFISDDADKLVRVETSIDGGITIFFDTETYTDVYYNYDMKPTDLLNCKVGDSVKYYTNDWFQKTTHYKNLWLNINTRNKIIYNEIEISAFNEPCNVVFVYSDDTGSSSKPIEYGYLKYLDQANKFLYIYINKEVWKYSYQINGRILSNFQFVEVVQS